MRKSKWSEEKIIGILKELEAGVSVSSLSRKNGVSEVTIYNWRKKYGGMEVSEAKRLRELESENGKLKKLLAEQLLEVTMLKDIVSKNF